MDPVQYCAVGFNFPEFCPRSFDSPTQTVCCRDGYTPACCEPRSNKVCAKTPTGRQSGYYQYPDVSWHVAYCPGMGQPDNNIVCCYNGGTASCCSTSLLAGIFGGVFGFMALLAIIIIAVCCYKVKKGDWVCVQIYPGKYTMMSRVRAEAYKRQREALARVVAHGMTAPGAAPQPGPWGGPAGGGPTGGGHLGGGGVGYTNDGASYRVPGPEVAPPYVEKGPPSYSEVAS